ncbi:hypothetical protein [Microtetraspora sp. NBRC 16547]|uniref:hypothetical protein n=1 Tax=Microtetraspora sp. NBRC 16547 TaxID=3030993 RepID=UPI002554DD17|nr:hypothetical protein [Microtetraspora sp. NBRC 16547]
MAHPVAASVTITAAIDGYLLQRALDPSLEPSPLIEGLACLVQPSDQGSQAPTA